MLVADQLHARSVARAAVIPDGVGFDVAATLPIAGLTALRAVELGAPVRGSRVLVTGGSGGVGQFAVRLGETATSAP